MKKQSNANSPSSLQKIILKKIMTDTSEGWKEIKEIYKQSFLNPKQSTLKILANLNRQLDTLILMTKEQHSIKPEINQAIAHVVTAYSAGLAVFCFANGWIDSGFLYTGTTAMLGGIDYTLYQKRSAAEDNLKYYRENLITIAQIIKTKLNLKNTENVNVESQQEETDDYVAIAKLTTLLKTLLEEANAKISASKYLPQNDTPFLAEKYQRLSIFVTKPQPAQSNVISQGYHRLQVFIENSPLSNFISSIENYLIRPELEDESALTEISIHTSMQNK